MPKDNTPIFDGYNVEDEDGDRNIAVLCEYCNSIHTHGYDPGLEVGEKQHKIAHCSASERPDYVPDHNDYYVELVDEHIYNLQHGLIGPGKIITD